MRLRLARGGVPNGWSLPSPILSIRWPLIKYFPPVWVESRPANADDIAALQKHMGYAFKCDRLSLVGKSSPQYTTLKDEYLK